MLEIQAILAKANAMIYYDQMKEEIILEDAGLDKPSIVFQNPDFI